MRWATVRRSWIWKAVQRVLTGCVQALDVFHACARAQMRRRIHGEGTKETKAAYKQGRGFALVSQGWAGVCQWVGELLAVDDEKERERRRPATDRLIGYFAKHVNRPELRGTPEGRPCRQWPSGRASQDLGSTPEATRPRWNKCNVAPMASFDLRPPLLAMGSLLGDGRLITPREFGYTRLTPGRRLRLTKPAGSLSLGRDGV